MSEDVTIPNSSSLVAASPSSAPGPSVTTSRLSIFSSYISCAAFSMASCGYAVITSWVITSPTRVSCRALVRSGSPKAGLASLRSRSETIPTSRPSSKIGMCLIRLSRQRVRASATLASGESVIGFRVIQSRTSSTIINLPHVVGCAVPKKAQGYSNSTVDPVNAGEQRRTQKGLDKRVSNLS